MNIAYNVKTSKFLLPCITGISENNNTLSQGQPIFIDLGKSGGYQGNIRVTINENEPNCFSTDWHNADPSRFPARIKAVATALYRIGLYGDYMIKHDSGTIQIVPL